MTFEDIQRFKALEDAVAGFRERIARLEESLGSRQESFVNFQRAGLPPLVDGMIEVRERVAALEASLTPQPVPDEVGGPIEAAMLKIDWEQSHVKVSDLSQAQKRGRKAKSA